MPSVMVLAFTSTPGPACSPPELVLPLLLAQPERMTRVVARMSRQVYRNFLFAMDDTSSSYNLNNSAEITTCFSWSQCHSLSMLPDIDFVRDEILTPVYVFRTRDR